VWVQLLQGEPFGGSSWLLFPAVREDLAAEFADGGSCPCAWVDAIGDVSDGNLIGIATWPEWCPHCAGDAAVECGDGVTEAAHAKRQHGHAEVFAVIGRLDFSELQQLCDVDSGGRGEWLQVCGGQGGGEAIVSGCHGGMSREDDGGGSGFASLAEGEAVFDHPSSQIFKRCESAVSFVEVHNGRFDIEGLQGAHAADSEEQFLADAGFQSGGIQSGGQQAVCGVVFREVGIEQEELAAAGGHAENAQLDGACGQFHGDSQRESGGRLEFGEGECCESRACPGFALPAGCIDGLVKESFVAEE